MQSKIFFTGYSALKLTRLKLLVLWVGSLATRSDALSESEKILFPQMPLFAVKELRVTLDGDNRFFGGVKQNVEFPFYKCAGS